MTGRNWTFITIIHANKETTVKWAHFDILLFAMTQQIVSKWPMRKCVGVVSHAYRAWGPFRKAFTSPSTTTVEDKFENLLSTHFSRRLSRQSKVATLPSLHFQMRYNREQDYKNSELRQWVSVSSYIKLTTRPAPTVTIRFYLHSSVVAKF